LGHPELALAELEIAQLTPDTVFSYSPALFDTYAVVLAELGRVEDAALWGERASRAAEALAEAARNDDYDSVTVVEMPVDED
jgi:hypothetical protein